VITSDELASFTKAEFDKFFSENSFLDDLEEINLFEDDSDETDYFEDYYVYQ